jgi:hypothetical protein
VKHGIFEPVRYRVGQNACQVLLSRVLRAERRFQATQRTAASGLWGQDTVRLADLAPADQSDVDIRLRLDEGVGSHHHPRDRLGTSQAERERGLPGPFPPQPYLHPRHSPAASTSASVSATALVASRGVQGSLDPVAGCVELLGEELLTAVEALRGKRHREGDGATDRVANDAPDPADPDRVLLAVVRDFLGSDDLELGEQAGAIDDGVGR